MKHARVNRRLIISKNLILMLVILVVGLLAVWSWFSVTKTVEANEMTVKTQFPDEVGLAHVKEYFNSDGSLDHEGPDVFRGQIEFPINSGEAYVFTKDCTGNGDTLIVPDFSVIKDKDEATRTGRIVNVNGAWEEALSNLDIERIKKNNPDTELQAQYMEFPFYVRSSTKSFDVTSISCVKSVTESNGGNLKTAITDSNNPKKSSYGNFNSDALVGAIRVAFLTQGVQSVTQTFNSGAINTTTATLMTSANSQTVGRELTMLWVPRPDIHLNVSTTGLTNDWTLKTGVLPSTTFDNGAENRCYHHDFYIPSAAPTGTEEYAAKGTTSNDPVVKNKGTGVVLHNEEDLGSSNSPFVVTDSSEVTDNMYPTLGRDFDASAALSYKDYVPALLLNRDAVTGGEESNFYVYRVTMRVWIEGTDSEARRAMDGGGFSIELQLK